MDLITAVISFMMQVPGHAFAKKDILLQQEIDGLSDLSIFHDLKILRKCKVSHNELD